MALVALLGISFIGSVFWVVSPEASSMYYASELGWNPLLVGVTCAAGQLPAFWFIYRGGTALVYRWSWLGRKVERTRQRWRRGLETAYLPLTFLGAILGVPPLIAMCALAGGFGVVEAKVIPVVYVGRAIRFTTLAYSGKQLIEWWSGLV